MSPPPKKRTTAKIGIACEGSSGASHPDEIETVPDDSTVPGDCLRGALVRRGPGETPTCQSAAGLYQGEELRPTQLHYLPRRPATGASGEPGRCLRDDPPGPGLEAGRGRRQSPQLPEQLPG